MGCKVAFARRNIVGALEVPTWKTSADRVIFYEHDMT